MKIEIKIDEGCAEPKIIVVTNKVTDEINEIVNAPFLICRYKSFRLYSAKSVNR